MDSKNVLTIQSNFSSKDTFLSYAAGYPGTFLINSSFVFNIFNQMHLALPES
jgi:hypothetical protein